MEKIKDISDKILEKTTALLVIQFQAISSTNCPHLIN